MKEAVIDFAKFEQEVAQTISHRERRFKSIPVGKCVRQGDIYIVRVKDNHPHGGIRESHQLAFGTSKGSRHIADRNFVVYEGTTLPKGVAAGTFLGPCIQTDCEATIEHPEHAWAIIPAGTYQILHQTDLQTRQRALD